MIYIVIDNNKSYSVIISLRDFLFFNTNYQNVIDKNSYNIKHFNETWFANLSKISKNNNDCRREYDICNKLLSYGWKQLL